MKKLVIQDEYAMTAFALHDHFKKCRGNRRLKKYDNIYFAGDGNFICDYLMVGVSESNSKFHAYKKTEYVLSGNESEYRKKILAQQDIKTIACEDFSGTKSNNNLIFLFVDTFDFENKDLTVKIFESIHKTVAGGRNTKGVITVLLPEIKRHSDTALGLSEDSVNEYFKNCNDKTPETEYFLEIKALFDVFKSEKPDCYTFLRFDNVFAPDRFHMPSLPMERIVEECVKNNKVMITDDDEKNYTSVTYVRNACNAVFKSAFCTFCGGEYNVSYDVVSLSLLKRSIFENYRNYFELSEELSVGIKHQYNTLSSDLFEKLNIGTVLSFNNSVKYAVSYLTGYEFDTSGNVAFYSGRIKTIQALEIEILKEIDRICRLYDIKYFLAGGSLLGAVRSGGPIPWDDDLDIGMLRGDFEKFRKVCEENLQEKFEFSSPFNGSGSHYTIEKVRLKSTYFSTDYSSKNIFPDGVFVDLLVYDQTCNNKLFRTVQKLMMAILYDCIILRWYNVARRNLHYWLSKILLPVLRVFPWGFYHGLFEFFAKLYMNKKDATLLIDSVGKKLKAGPLPKEGLQDTVYVDFGGIKAPVPVDYTGYLNYAYGPDYLEKPNLSNRRCPHNFARIDLGKYIFDINGETQFREVSLLGELYELEDEI